MTTKEINDFRRRVEGFINTRRLRDAIYELRDMARRRMAWEVNDRLQAAEENYNYLLSYLTQGINDPDRPNVYNNIVSDLYSVLDALVNFMERAENPSLYYGTLRFNLSRSGMQNISDMVHDWRRLRDDLSLTVLSDPAGTAETTKNLQKTAETLQDNLFMRVWTTPALSAEDAAAIESVIGDEDVQSTWRVYIVSAVSLGLMQQFDMRRLRLLIDTYDNAENIHVSSAALVGLLLGLWHYQSRPVPKSLADRIAALKEKDSWQSDLSLTFIEMIRARDTERINRKMRDELIPKMQSLRPDIMRKINISDATPEDLAAMQENPEWQEMLDSTGITDQIKEMTEMQMEGADVMMSTFSHLKNFPFFRRLSNWFLPFDPQHSEIRTLGPDYTAVADVISHAPFLCDSDKYSFIFAVKQVPAQQRDMMLSQLRAQAESLMDMDTDSTDRPTPELRRAAVNGYMQNIYRFYKLFDRRNEFFDPFDTGINLISVPVLSDEFSDVRMLEVVAEFYFKLKYMKEALEVYQRMEQLAPGNEQRYQKMGYAYERLHDYEQAIEYYQRAELLDSRSQWTIKRLAACYRAIGDKQNALKYYKRLSNDHPDDLQVALSYGYVLTETGDYKEAIKQFFKVEFLDEKSNKSWRPLAWTLFLTGDFDGADRYYHKIIMDHPSANDYLNMGHVALARKDMHSAINYYRLALEQSDNDREWLMQALAEDSDSLREAGVDLDLVPLIADATLL